jgi:shikimate dehydrogenase
MLRVGVIGDPVAHSLSPSLQQPALDALGIPARYELWPTPAAELPGRIAGLRAPDVMGANVTLPHKRAVMDLIDEVSPTARRAGAVNTIVNREGHLFGDNTDIAGFATALSDVAPEPEALRALVLGAGGAARGVVLALAGRGVGQITLANRNPDRARQLATDLVPVELTAIKLNPEHLRVALPATTLLINATSLGWKPGESPLALELLDLLPDGAIVVDLTYRETDLLAAARARGLTTLDGLPMLIHQGAHALTLWTGQAAPVEVMRTAAMNARDAQAAREGAG